MGKIVNIVLNFDNLKLVYLRDSNDIWVLFIEVYSNGFVRMI